MRANEMGHKHPFRGQHSLRGQGALRAAASLASIAALAVACSSPQLVPVTASGSGTARVQSDGVLVEVDGKASESPVYLPADVEPLRIAIHNASDRGIHVSLDSIELARGDMSISPVPPSQIEPRPYVTGTGLDPASPFVQIGPGPAGVDLRLANHHPELYRQMTFGDTGADARRAEIVSKGFTDGFIDAGETREGFVYFANVPKAAGELNLVIPVHTGQGSGAVTTLTIPLEVKS